MFPDDEIEVVDISLTEENELNVFNGKAFLFDYKTGDFVYKNGAPVLLEGKEALKAWIEKCLRTTKNKAAIHRDLDYGPNIEDLIGSSFDRDFVKAEIDRECRESLLKNPYITRIDSLEFEIFDDELIANITITTTYDTIRLEVNM